MEISLLGPTANPTNHGGKIISIPKYISLYYGRYWKSPAGMGDRRFEDGFAKYFPASKYTTVLAQYGVGRGKFLGSSVVVTPATPSRVNETVVQRIVRMQIDSGAAPMPDGSTIYTLFLPPKMVLTASGGESSLDGLGGYHGSFDYKNGERAYYAVIAYSDAANGFDFNGKARDNLSIIASHEWAEATTDPDVNNGRLGWYDERLGEIADIPVSQGGSPRDLYARLGRYAFQKLWSIVDHRNEVAAK